MTMIGFKQELLEQYKAHLEIIVRNIGGITGDRAADMLIASITHLKSGDQVEDSPVYKVAVAMNALRKDNFIGIATRKALAEKIEAASGLKTQQVRNLLNHYEWRLPNHLKPVRKLGRTLQDVPPKPPEEKNETQEVKLEGDRVSEIKIKGAGIEITIKILKE